MAHVKPGIYQFNWDTGSCVTFPMPGFAVERPDSFVKVGASHKARELVDGRWTDYWYYWFDANTTMGHIAEPFNLWQDADSCISRMIAQIKRIKIITH